ncbi:MFS transporter [Actinomycetes bacterium M1A6_2h]
MEAIEASTADRNESLIPDTDLTKVEKSMHPQSEATTLGKPTISARLDVLPATRLHIWWIVVLGLGYLIEMYDNVVFAYVAPTIRAEWGLTIGQVGLVTSAVFIGMMVGAVTGGRLSDRFGRKPVLIWTSVFYSAMSLVSAIAPNFEVLFVSRILTGFGVQAAAGVILVFISEMFPTSSRGRFFTTMVFFGSFATPLTSLAALNIAPAGVGAWRWVFVIGSVGIVIAALVAFTLPESLRWLETTGKTERAERIVGKIENLARHRGELPAASTTEVATPRGTYRELLVQPYLRRLLLLCSSFFVFITCVYGFIGWLPTVLVDKGLEQSEALRVSSLASIGAVIGPLVLFALSDRIERKTAVFCAAMLGGVAMIVFGQSTNPTVTLVSAIVVQMATIAATTSFYTYIPEVFPTHVRGVGAGIVAGIGRAGGVVSGVSVAALYSGFGVANLYLTLGAAMCAVGVLLVVLGPKTTGLSLEQISRA